MKLKERADGRFALEGVVAAVDVNTIRDAAGAILSREGADAETQVFDLSGVVDGNSVMIALMMGLLRDANRQSVQIVYRGVPGPLHELIEFYGLDRVLPMEADQ